MGGEERWEADGAFVASGEAGAHGRDHVRAGVSHSVLAGASRDAGEPAQPRVSPQRRFAERRGDPGSQRRPGRPEMERELAQELNADTTALKHEEAECQDMCEETQPLTSNEQQQRRLPFGETRNFSFPAYGAHR